MSQKHRLRHFRKIRPTLDKDKRFAFFYIRKAGSMSVQRNCLKDRAIVRKDNEALYDDLLAGMTDGDIKGLFKFAIVRNPFARVVSAWEYLRGQNRIPGSFTFEGFVKSQDLPEYDIHFHRQSDHLFFYGKAVVEFIGKLENIDVDWPFIAAIIGAPKELPHANKTNHDDWRKYYCHDGVKQRIQEIYKDDFELLEYDCEI